MTTSGAISIEGRIAPTGLLTHLRDGTLGPADSHAPSAYHLGGRQTINDAVSRAWTWLLGSYQSWQEAQVKDPNGFHSTSPTLTRDRWLLPLLQELGFGRLSPSGGIDLAREGTPDHYPVSYQWEQIPIHLLGPGVDLDHRNPGVPGAARAPQAMIQELLNRDDDRLWAILSNGHRLRLLRDSKELAGSAYIEIDLDAIFSNESFADFLLLWKLCHVSRLEPRPGPEGEKTLAECWLEIWRADAARTGERALDHLRDGVTQAIERLGSGFIAHPANGELRDALRSGALSTEAFHRHLLRLVYRLIFLFVTEDRDLLIPTAAVDDHGESGQGDDRHVVSPATKKRYIDYFSTQRLRRQAYRRSGSTTQSDLWQGCSLVLRALGSDDPRRIPLGLPVLGGLFDPTEGKPFSLEKSVAYRPDEPLVTGHLDNHALLKAIRALSWFPTKQGLQPVDYRNLDFEELGGVYESLLELVPRPSVDTHTYKLVSVGGNDRKTTGSYYTPTSLVDTLLASALDPVVDEKLRGAPDQTEAEKRLLSITVCDPACGSGHFLVGAARRLARRLASIRSGEDEPTPSEVRKALRDVVGRCVYGVDLNPLAAELAKVSLWIAAADPGKPLLFLDSRIRVGNSLLNATPALVEEGLPDEAFTPITGDDKKVAAAAKKRNKKERDDDPRHRERFAAYGDNLVLPGLDIRATDQESLFTISGSVTDDDILAREHEELLGAPNDVSIVRGYARRFRDIERSPEHRRRQILCDAWLAAFVWPLKEEAAVPAPGQIYGGERRVGPPAALTTDTLVQLRAALETNSSITHLRSTIAEVETLAHDYHFFHWHIEFPEIFDTVSSPSDKAGPEGWSGGFDCVIGNPPWDLIELNEKEYFSSRDPDISTASGAQRKRLISNLESSDPFLYSEYFQEKHEIDATRKVLSASQRYPLTGHGRINKYSVFAELFSTIVAPHGQAGIIVPTGIATDATTQHYFKDLVTRHRIHSLYDFENAAPIFDGVHRSFKFCLLTTSGLARPIDNPTFAFFLHDPRDIESSTFTMTPEEITLVNPNTGTLPIFRTRRDAEITLGIYRRVPVLIKEGDSDGNPWGIRFMQGLFNMTSDSHLFHTREELEDEGWVLNGNVFERPLPPVSADAERVEREREREFGPELERMMPLYEAKMIHLYDTRWATYEPDGATRLMIDEEKYARKPPMPRYWVPEDEIDKKLQGKWDKNWFLGWRDICRATDERTCISAMLPRVAVGNKLPLALADQHHDVAAALQSIMASFAFDFVARQKLGSTTMNFFILQQLAAPHPGFNIDGLLLDRPLYSWIGTRVDRLNAWTTTAETRDHLRAELDALMFHVYGLNREDAAYIMETFPIVKRKDEAAHGEYRTKRLILEVYDAMAEVIGSGQVYQSASTRAAT
ncbi:MAG: N-6 DNA methylase [Propionibacteriaceae bacterium]|jgi:hypothetical protein|nr:N-6 DNA methylase [Propionibacteriaceae bacterium]